MLRLPRPGRLLLAALALAPAALDAAPRDRMLVSPAWVAARLGDPALVLFHIGTKAGYDSAHIAGARFLPLATITERKPSGTVFELPPVARLDSVFAAAGVGPDSRIVLYFGSDWVSPTTRAWFTFDYLGLGARTVILDGGLPAWRAAGRPVTADPPPAARAVRAPGSHPRPDAVVDAGWVQGHLGAARLTIIDARDREFYRGLEPGMHGREGHLPGAVSLPFHTLFDSTGRFLPDSALRRRFTEAGVKPGQQVVAYCHIGQQATVVYFAARLLGLDVRLYDGSYTEWEARAELPVEGGIPATRAGLVDPAHLADRIAAGEVTVLDARGDLPAYLAGHLPGAVYLHFESLRQSRGGTPGDALTAQAYGQLFGALGVRPDRPVVVYGSGDAANFNATFALWVLSGLRHPEVYLLDGGFGAWAAAGKPVERRYPDLAPVSYPDSNFALEVAEAVWLRGSLGRPDVAIVDVRPRDQYEGQAGAQLRRGHIPGAIHHFWQDDLVADGAGKRWKSVEALRAAYVAQGITPDKQVFVYCNTGTEASHVYFALRHLLGYPRVRVYVPSWTEWAEREDLPVESETTASGT
ncbi:MAG: sulfurtransferase [Gemmatimonadetes bacterium]|nr:sulfurtransferase [Gemmatimonadota bacterium]